MENEINAQEEEPQIPQEELVVEEEEIEVDVDAMKAELAKYKRIAEQREKKIQKLTSETGTRNTTPTGQVAHSMDPFEQATLIAAMQKSGLDHSDKALIAELKRYAELKGQDLASVIDSSIGRALINESNEYKRSAEVVNTGAARRGSPRVSDEQLMSNALAGKAPESDADMKRLIEMRLKNR